MIKVKIEKLVYGGKGIGKIEGKTCFVPYVLPDEEVEVKIKREKKSFLECEPVKIIKESPFRIEPICKYFGYCGGCDYMHIEYKKQIEIKKEILIETLQRIGKIENPNIEKVFPSKEPLHYRNRVQFKIRKEKIGFFQKESKEIINIDYCYLLKNDLNNVLIGLRELLPFFSFRPVEAHFFSSSENNITGKLIFTKKIKSFPLGFKHFKAFLGENLIGIGIYFQTDGNFPKRISFLGEPFAYEKVKDYRFRVSVDSFFQVNRFQLGNLINLVEEELNEEKPNIAFDLYCGVGTFSIPMARYANRVFGVEINPYAIQDANHNKKINHANNVYFHRAAAKDVLKYMVKKSPDLVLVDPPRTGLDKDTTNALLQIKNLKKIIYISCNPSTLARDIKTLTENGFNLKKIFMIDMFPNTYHIESFSVLEKKKKNNF